jgi:two-component system, repressor protein LuxO
MCASSAPPTATRWRKCGAGNFREDLYYRLHVVPVRMPPLRDRGEDVIEIAERLLADMGQEEGHAFTGLDAM